jgi:hypothetical protein
VEAWGRLGARPGFPPGEQRLFPAVFFAGTSGMMAAAWFLGDPGEEEGWG